jgi:ATP-binding cassette subfamily F protein 3
MRGDRVGIIGHNGAGKSTFLRALVGEHPVDAGVLRIGGSIRAAHYRQDMAQVPLDRTLYQIINDLRPLWTRGQIQSHLARFGFSGDEVQRRSDTLSGGERARVALAIMMLEGANLLILDEPTNHLDVESIEALEDAVERYPGSVLLVSHDRALLRALATRVWVLENQRITAFDGPFAEWEEAAEAKAQAAAAAPAGNPKPKRTGSNEKSRENGDADRAAARRARASAAEAADAAEARVANAEARFQRLSAEVADPDLYATPEGAARGQRLGADLDRARQDLDAALEAWAAATEELDRI